MISFAAEFCQDLDVSIGEDPTFKPFDDTSLDVLEGWKFQLHDRFGGGTPTPSTPRSQRAYDGNTWEDYCESWP
ncbi:hypothetical protein OAE37_00050 [Pirellulaceae bacterium]|nr:hypothetical protein [Pirellulaceae bacterium]